MGEEMLKILDLIKEGKITPEKATELISLSEKKKSGFKGVLAGFLGVLAALIFFGFIGALIYVLYVYLPGILDYDKLLLVYISDGIAKVGIFIFIILFFKNNRPNFKNKFSKLNKLGKELNENGNKNDDGE